jgi:hypothetical protein
MSNSKMPYKCGQYVRLNQINHDYLFLGYIDNDCKRGIVADVHGNKVEVEISKLSKK